MGLVLWLLPVAVPALPALIEHLRAEIGGTVFDSEVAAGAALEFGDAVAYARHQIRLARPQSERSA